MTHYHQVSGGLASWLAAKVGMRNNPTERHRFVFADTLYEDADCYRFLLEGIAHLLGRSLAWIPRAEEFPDYRVSGDFDIATYAGNHEWRSYLAELRERAALELPELVWLVEGRDPWEVFRDVRFLGNSRVDPCSRALKREVIDAWRDGNCNPVVDVFSLGIGSHEDHRFLGRVGQPGLRDRMAATGWTYVSPLIGTIESDIPFHFLAKSGLVRPRLYRKRYVHNNCGGFCIKAGHGHYLNRLGADPDRYAYDETMERKISEWVGQPVTMLTDRRGGDKVMMSLGELRASVSAGMFEEVDNEPGDSGCGCMIDP